MVKVRAYTEVIIEVCGWRAGLSRVGKIKVGNIYKQGGWRAKRSRKFQVNKDEMRSVNEASRNR